MNGYQIVPVPGGVDLLTGKRVTRWEVRTGGKIIADFPTRTRAERWVKAQDPAKNGGAP